MAHYRSAQGRSVDMAALAAKNEKTRAVGNMKVNARGDTIDSTGKVIKPVTAKVTDQYARTVSNRSARPTPAPQPQQAQRPTIQPDSIVEERLPVEEDFDSEDDLEIEQIKEQEVKEATKAKK
jgi:hypothetical protein